MNRKKKFMVLGVIFLSAVFLGVYKVLAEVKFNVAVTADKTIINEINTDEKITLTLSSKDIPETGLSSGQFYIEYNQDVFEVDKNSDNTIEENKGIEYLQDKSSYFSNSVTESDGKEKITVLYYSETLESSLSNGNLFKVTLNVKSMPKKDKETIKIYGSAFGTIIDNKITEIEGVFEDKDITFREKNITLTNVYVNKSNNSSIYNRANQELSLDFLTTDLENATLKTNIKRKNLYGDNNLDGVITPNDVENVKLYYFGKYTSNGLPYILSDVRPDGQIDMEDYQSYVNKYEYIKLDNSKSVVGKINKDLSEIYRYGDINSDGKIDYDDLTLIEQFLENEKDNELNEKQQLLAKIISTDKVSQIDHDRLNDYLSGMNINTYLDDDSLLIYGDAYKDGIIDGKDITTLNDYIGITENYYHSEGETEYYPVSSNQYELDYEYVKKLSNWYEKYGSYNENKIGSIADISTIKKYGDLNSDGNIDDKDVTMLNDYIKGNLELDDTQLKLADVDKSGSINADDLTTLKYYLGYQINTSDVMYQYTESVDSNNLFEITTNPITKNVGINKINLKTKDSLEPGYYDIEVEATKDGKTYKSNTYTVLIKAEPVTSINFYEEEYVVGVDEDIEPKINIMPENAYIKNVKYEIEDSSIAKAYKEQSSIGVTGKKVGETILYATSLDGSKKVAQTKIKVVDKAIQIMSSETKINKLSSKNIENKFYDQLGASFELKLKLIGIADESLSYKLYKTDDSTETNLFDNAESVELTKDDTYSYLKFNINKNKLKAGNYTFKVVSEDGTTSNTINFEVYEYHAVTEANIMYNNTIIDSINVMVNDEITLSSQILPENATDKKVKWSVSGFENNIKTTENEDNTFTFSSNKVGSGTITMTSDDNSDIKKTIKINVIDLNNNNTTVAIKSNINNPNIDTKYGGKITATLEFDNTNITSELNVKLLDSNKNEVNGDYYTVNNPSTENGISNIEIDILPNKLTEDGNYYIYYKYNLNDIKHTEKTGEIKITIEPFIQIEDLNLKIDSLVLIKNTNYIFNDYEITNVDATNREIKITSNNDNVVINDNIIITANKVGESILIISTTDGSDISKTINVKIVESDITSDKYEIDKINKYILKLKDKQTKDILSSDFNIDSSINAKLLNTNKEQITDNSTFIGTGMILQTYKNENQLLNEYQFIVSGDINGDGKILANDILAQKMHILEKSTLKGIYFIAGDINEDNSVNAIDILYLKRYILEKTTNVWGIVE